VTVEFQVTLRAASRHVRGRAQDTEDGVVGWRSSSTRRRRAQRAFSETIPTTAAATTGLVPSCWIP
jgi:hypothetical protein